MGCQKRLGCDAKKIANRPWHGKWVRIVKGGISVVIKNKEPRRNPVTEYRKNKIKIMGYEEITDRKKEKRLDWHKM